MSIRCFGPRGGPTPPVPTSLLESHTSTGLTVQLSHKNAESGGERFVFQQLCFCAVGLSLLISRSVLFSTKERVSGTTLVKAGVESPWPLLQQPWNLCSELRGPRGEHSVQTLSLRTPVQKQPSHVPRRGTTFVRLAKVFYGVGTIKKRALDEFFLAAS